MDAIRAATLDLCHLRSQAGEIRGENRWGDFDGFAFHIQATRDGFDL
jgi:hypothetical protein